MAVLCILLLHVKWSHLLALQITEHIQKLRRHERIWNCCHFSHLPSLLSPSSSSTLELILRFLLSEASLPKGLRSIQSKKHGRASKSERMLVLSLKETLQKAKLVKLSSLYSEIFEQNKAPHLCCALASFSTPCLIILFLSTLAPGQFSASGWNKVFLDWQAHVVHTFKLHPSSQRFSRDITVQRQEYIIPGSRWPAW